MGFWNTDNFFYNFLKTRLPVGLYDQADLIVYCRWIPVKKNKPDG